jgi:adenylylsulfate kinase
MKILIFGLPGSGKTTLATPLARQLGAVHINADEVRTKYDDWDFSPEGRMRQANRMKHLSDGVVMAGKIAVTDFVCPTEAARKAFNPDFTIWLDTIVRGRFEDTNNMFETPYENVDYHVTGWFDDTHEKLIKVIERYQELHVSPGFEKDADGNIFVAHDTVPKRSMLGIHE